MSIKPPQGTPVNTEHPLCPDRFAAPIWEGSGSTIEDVIGDRTGTITGGSWTTDADGNIVLAHTVTWHKVDFGAAVGLVAPTQGTFVFGYQKRDATNRQAAAWGVDPFFGNNFGLFLPLSNGNAYVQIGDNPQEGTGQLTVPGLTYGGNDVWVVSYGARGTELWQNGMKRGSQAGHGTWPATGGNFTFGKYNVDGDLANYSFMWIYSTQLSEANIEAISAEPYAFFGEDELPPPMGYSGIQPHVATVS